MTEADKKLLFEDLCGRLPYGVKAKVLGWDEENEEELYVNLRVYSINTDGYVYFESNDYDVDYVQFDDCQLYLRPMSSMTEEEIKELGEIDAKRIVFSSRHLTYGIDAEVIAWLNAHHFDYHGLIAKGLAIKVTKDNNPYL